MICHCYECQKVSGSAFTTNLVVPTDNFKITSGSETLKSYAAPHQSGMTLTIYFCCNCGSAVYKVGDSDAFKGTVIVQAGTLDGEIKLDDMKLGAELWVSQRVRWLGALHGVGQMQQFS